MYYTVISKIFINVTPQEMWNYAVASDRDFGTFTGFGFIPAIVGVKHIKGNGYTPGSVNRIKTSDGGELEETVIASKRPEVLQYQVRKYHFPFTLVVQSAEGKFEYRKSGKGMEEVWTYKYKLASVLSWPLALIVLGVFFQKAMDIKLQNQKRNLEGAS